jgi:hypothetical protein
MHANAALTEILEREAHQAFVIDPDTTDSSAF